MQLWLIRHALPVRIEDAGGPADPGLTATGRRQATCLAGWLAGVGIDAVWSSPLRRARETASPLAATLWVEVVIDEGLAEFDRDADSYIPIEEMKAEGDPRWQELVDGRWAADGQGQAFQDTVFSAVERIIAAHPGGDVALVCHGGVVNTYLAQVLGLAEPFFFFDPDYTSISRVRAARSGERSIASVNETGHLYFGPPPSGGFAI